MIGLIQSRSYQICHSGIKDKELLGNSILDIQHSGNQRPTLTYYSTPKLEMQSLMRTKLQESGIRVEIPLEVGNRGSVRLMIVNSETSAYIQ